MKYMKPEMCVLEWEREDVVRTSLYVDPADPNSGGSNGNSTSVGGTSW